MFDKEAVWKRANELYAEEKTKKYGPGEYEIQIDSAKALLFAIIEALNARVQY